MLYLIFLIVETLLFETSGLKLTCTNDYETSMSCHIDARNCTVKLTLNDTESYKTRTCAFDPCARGCCCELDVTHLLFSNTFLAEVYEGEQSVHSQTIEVYETIKPPNPAIISVDQINEMYQIKWRTNATRSLRESLWAIVTLQRKGDKPKISDVLKPSTVEDINYYEILGQNLEPSTTYVVSVKTYTTFNISSDSKEVEFTTARNDGIIAVILSLCVVSIVVSGVLFASFIKLKGKLWDNAVKVENPNLLNIKPKKQRILTSESLLVHSFTVEPLVQKKSLTLSEESLSDSCGRSGQTRGMSSALSSLDYAKTEPVNIEASVLEALKIALPMFTPSMHAPGSGESQTNCGFFQSETITVPLAFDNTCYMTQSPKTTYDVDRRVASDSRYHSSDAPQIQDLLIPPHFSTVETDMSYQPCLQSKNAADSHIILPVVYGFQDFERQPNNVPSEHNRTQSNSLVDCLLIFDEDSMQHQGRLRLRAWLEEQIHSGKYPGVRWIDRSAQIFQIPWKHAARHGWNIDRDATLFRSWAMHTGRYEPGKDKPDAKTWKANFRCALNSLSDICELREHSKKKGTNAYRVYRMLPNKQTLRRKRGQRSNRHAANRDNDRCAIQQPAAIKSTLDPGQKDSFNGTSSNAMSTDIDEQEQKEAVFKLMDHLNSGDSWSHMCEPRTWRTHSLDNHWHWSAEDFTPQTESYNELFPNYIRELNDWSSYHQMVTQ